MTTHHHSAIATGESNAPSTLNTRFSALDSAIGDLGNYSSAAAWLGSLTLANGAIIGTLASNTSTTTVTVGSGQADAFVDNARVAYLVDGEIEYNTVSSASGTTITLGTSPSGQIDSGTLIAQVSESEYQAAQQIPHSGVSMTLPRAVWSVGETFYNVNNYGNIGQGNDATAINAALTAAASGRGRVIMPSSLYTITDSIVVPSNVNLNGLSRMTTRLTVGANVPGIVLDGTEIEIGYMYIQPYSTADIAYPAVSNDTTGGTGSTQRFYIHDIHIRRNEDASPNRRFQHGILITDAYYVTIERCKVLYGASQAQIKIARGVQSATTVNIQDCTVWAGQSTSSLIGIHFDGAIQCQITNPIVENCIIGILIENSDEARDNFVFVLSPYFENCQTQFSLNAARNVVIQGGYYFATDDTSFRFANGTQAVTILGVCLSATAGASNKVTIVPAGEGIASSGSISWLGGAIDRRCVTDASGLLSFVGTRNLESPFGGLTSVERYAEFGTRGTGTGATRDLIVDGPNRNVFVGRISDTASAHTAFALRNRAGNNYFYGVGSDGTGNGAIGFFGTSPNTRQTITGSRGGNTALANLLTALASYGLIVDSSS